MCLCCCCCTSAKCCTCFIATVTALESFLYVCFNLALIFSYTCTIVPEEEPHLTKTMKEIWSWFFYDEDNCKEKLGEDYYTPPAWIKELPDSIDGSIVADEVSASSNYAYQVIYVMLHILWFFSTLLLIYGNARKQWNKLIPWLVISLIIIILDTVVGSFYIILMIGTNLGLDEGSAVFCMQLIYFRGYFLYLFNIVGFVIVLLTFCQVYCKRRKQQKIKKELVQKRTTEVEFGTTMAIAAHNLTLPPEDDSKAVKIYGVKASGFEDMYEDLVSSTEAEITQK